MKDLTEYLNQHHHADIEAKGFWESVHSLEDIWCLCSIVEDGTIFLWHDYPEYDGVEVYDKDDKKTYTIPVRSGSLIEGFRFWYKIGQAGGKLHVHNAMTYDKPIIEKVLPKCKIPTEAWVDTFIQSKVQFFDRSCPKGAKSAHGLKAMGIKSGVKKPDIFDWTTMDAYKLHRVVEDVKIQQFTSKLLDGEKVKLESLGIDLTEALKMEAEYAKVCHEQEVAGALVNKEHIKACIKQWDDRLDELTKTIEPLLPMTLKPKGQKVSKKTLAGLLGYDNSKIKEEFETVKRDGELVEVEVKPYYKPVTDFTITERTNCYSGFHITYGDSPEYVKKKDLTDWVKTTHPDTKTKEWEIEKEIKEKILLNKYTCEYFGVEPEDTDIISGPHTRIEYIPSRMTQHEVVKGFLIKSGIKHVKEWNFKKDSDGNFVKAKEDMVVSYPPKKLPEFQLHYTVKKGDPIVSSPKMSEDDYEQLSDDNGLLVAEYNTTMHRRRFLSNPKDPENKGLLSYVREDGRIPARVNNFMTATGRSSHGVWVNPPGAGALYGKQVRECIVAPEGRVLVGADQRSAQLSIAAYYANNYEYYKAVAEGEEFKTDEKGNEILHPDTGKPWYIGESGHCVNARAFTLVSDEEWKKAVEFQDQDLIHSISLRRKKSKGSSFACIFGASGKKVAATLNIPENLGNEKKNAFLNSIGLDRVIEITDKMIATYPRGKGGYIEVPFGYYVYCSQKHKQFNYIDQSTEAACQKWAELYFDRESKRLGLDCKKVISMHDEFLVESAEDCAQEVGALMNKAFEEVSIALLEWHTKHSKFFVGDDLPKFAINLSAGFKIGKTYWDVH